MDSVVPERRLLVERGVRTLFMAFVLALSCRAEDASAPPPEPVPAPAPAKPILLDGIRIRPAEGYLELDGAICLDTGLIEVFASSPGGKLHESMLVIKPKPQFIHMGLIILGLKEGKGCDVQGDAKNLPRGEPVDLFVEWEEGGKTWRIPAEELVYNIHTKADMEKGNWVFTGSRFVKDKDPNTGQERDIYLANATGTVITTFRDPSSILDNASQFSADDTSYVVNEAVVPSRGTPVRLLAMPKGKGPAARREIVSPAALSEEDGKRVPKLIDIALSADGTAAAEAVRTLSSMGRAVLGPVRVRVDSVSDEQRNAALKLLGDLREAIRTGKPPPKPQPPQGEQP